MKRATFATCAASMHSSSCPSCACGHGDVLVFVACSAVHAWFLVSCFAPVSGITAYVSSVPAVAAWAAVEEGALPGRFASVGAVTVWAAVEEGALPGRFASVGAVTVWAAVEEGLYAWPICHGQGQMSLLAAGITAAYVSSVPALSISKITCLECMCGRVRVPKGEGRSECMCAHAHTPH
eukprot:30011-Chlamydomonas_euryale.AAC.9